MGRRHGGWPERVPRPKAVKLSKEVLQRLQARAAKFVERAIVLSELVEEVQLARGRLYLWQESEDLMARITPLGPRAMLLETPRRNSWTEHKRGQLATVLKYVERDTRGTFHGLGSLVAKKRGAKPSAQQILQRNFKVPIRVLAEPEYWYSMHRKPAIAEVNVTEWSPRWPVLTWVFPLSDQSSPRLAPLPSSSLTTTSATPSSGTWSSTSTDTATAASPPRPPAAEAGHRTRLR